MFVTFGSRAKRAWKNIKKVTRKSHSSLRKVVFLSSKFMVLSKYEISVLSGPTPTIDKPPEISDQELPSPPYTPIYRTMDLVEGDF